MEAGWMRSSMSCFVVGDCAGTAGVRTKSARAAISFGMFRYTSIIGRFGRGDFDRPWVRFTIFVLTAACPDELFDGSVPATHGCAFEAIEYVENSGFVRQPAESESGEHQFRFLGMEDALTVDLLRHDAGFEGDEARAITVGDDRGVDRESVRWIGGTRGGEVEFEPGAEFGQIAGFEIGRDQGFGNEGTVHRVEAVAAVVAGGLLFAGGGDGSAGPGAVDAGGFALEFGSHAGYSMHEVWGAGALGGGDGVCFVEVGNFELL